LHGIRFIEVKRRIAEAERLMVTGDGILHALAVTGASLPALVKVSPGAVADRVRHTRRPSGETVPDDWHRGTDPS
jgi:hypothetical protein